MRRLKVPPQDVFLLNRLKNDLIKFLSEGDVDSPYIYTQGKMHSKKDLADEIANNTHTGKEIIKKLLFLTLDKLSRDKKGI